MDILDDTSFIEKKLVSSANISKINLSVAIELTPLCNFHCDMCYVRMEKKDADSYGGILPLDFWLSKAEELKKEGALFILLTGGEPLLYPGFTELYLKLQEMGFIVSVNTNGTLLTEEIADLFATHKPRRVNVTLYGASNETYERLCHVKNGYEKAVHGIHLLKERGIQMRLNLTQVTTNQEDFQKLLQFADQEGIFTMAANYISVFSSPQKTSEEILKVRNTPYQAALNEVNFKAFEKRDGFMEYVKEQQEYLHSPNYPDYPGCTLSCRAGKSSSWITWRGMLQACVDLPSPCVSLQENSIHEAWEKLKTELQNLPIHTECKDCKLKPLCDVCYANATNEKKHCGSLNYLCEMAKAKADILCSL